FFYRLAIAAITQFAWTAGALTVTLPSLPLVYCAALVFVVTVVCAIGPAFSVSRMAPGPAIIAGSSRSSGGRPRARHVLVIAQVAICFVLLSGASLLFHDLLRIRAIDPGFDTTHTMSVEV